MILIKKNKTSRIIYSIAGILLLLPYVAMQFSSEVNWTVIDFGVASVLLFSLTFILNLIINKIKPKRSKIILMIIVFLAFIILWVEMAVGIFGSPIAGN